MPTFVPIISRPVALNTVAFLPLGRVRDNQNLVTNGDMERIPTFTAATTTTARFINGTAAGSNAATSQYTWALISKVGSAAAQFDTSVSHNGVGSLKLSTTATASQGVCSNTTANTNVGSQAVPITPSTKYVLTIWMKTLANSGSAATGARLACNERTPAGTFVAAANFAGVPTTTGWTKYTINYTSSSATGNYLDIQPSVTGNNGTGTLIMDAWFDDLVLKRV